MTISRSAILHLLVLAAVAMQPATAAAQGTRPSTSTATPRAGAPASPASAARPPAATAATRPWNEQDYRLGPGDKLRVEVYREPQISQSLQVRPDGKITLPLVGDLMAADRTSIELRDAITASLKEYVNNPAVTVIVQEAASAQVFVIGEIASPGTQILQGPTTVLQALAQAGGFKEFADQKAIRILRRNGTGTQTITFNYKDAIKGRTEAVYLQPGDTIVVP